jgi:hypothetical protein
MNQQERKYIAKRIEQEEVSAVKRIRDAELKTPDAEKAFNSAVKSLTDQQVKELVASTVNGLSARQLRGMLTVVTHGGTYNYRTGHTEPRTADVKVTLTVVAQNKALPTEVSFNEFAKARKDEQKAKDALIAKIEKRAARCRDRAMLGDGSAALAAFEKFIAELTELESA